MNVPSDGSSIAHIVTELTGKYNYIGPSVLYDCRNLLTLNVTQGSHTASVCLELNYIQDNITNR